jgi:hypothetical protein
MYVLEPMLCVMSEFLGDGNSKCLKNVVEVKSEEDIKIVKLEYLYIRHATSG